ncbi:MAG: FAD-dependent oxidoreductase [Planctomycetota bacterium]
MTNHVETDCCIVGAGPAGAMLAFLLARQGVRVLLLEARDDFDRDFRGDTLHSSSLEILDQLGLADDLLKLPHNRLEQAVFETPAGTVAPADFRELRTRFPFVALIPQEQFLAFLTERARQFDGFELKMGANVRELIKEGDQVTGVLFEDDSGKHEVTARLVVACDGRFSRIRKQSGLQAIATSPPMDVLWFRLPHDGDHPNRELMGRIGDGRMLIVLPRRDHDQVGYVILKGGYRDIRDQGIQSLRDELLKLAPEFGDRVNGLEDFKSIAPLTVNSDRLKQWYLPGLLLIGDAAHVMSPVGGVGINYAIQDAVAASNLLGTKLLKSRPSVHDLRKVQRRRELPTRVIQLFQTIIQRRIIQVALDPSTPFRIPWFLRLPLVRRLPARLIAFGLRRERVNNRRNLGL